MNSLNSSQADQQNAQKVAAKSDVMTLGDNWGVVLLLCAYGFFKEVKPSEPYLTQYLTGKSKLYSGAVDLCIA